MPIFLPGALLTTFVVLLTSIGPRATPPKRPECPDHKFWPVTIDTTKRTAVISSTPVVIPLVDAGTNVPEFNDCQQLITPQNHYGPVVAVFARQADFPVQPDPDRFYLAAVIFNFGMLGNPYVRYAPLHLAPGYSCVYLPLIEPITNAHVVSNGNDGNCKADISTPPTPNLEARVRPTVAGDVVPRAARWEWDARRRTQYIGTSCLKRWCEIGARGFQPAPDPPLGWLAGLSLSMGPVHRVRAYFDTQRLAEPTAGVSPMQPVTLSKATGYIFPAPNLGQLNSASDFDIWRYVSTMIITEDHPKYRHLFGMRANVPTHVYLMRNTGTPDPALPALPPGFWGWARYETGANRKVIPIWRAHHPEVHTPGMVRWRWLWEDETTWIRCLEGCCSTTGSAAP